ncbi:MAG: M48 family metalloprotease [Deltaproteobacteria bacterium]|nr:M48 family metalloprotease [Deltaproteobacteria bacterium]
MRTSKTLGAMVMMLGLGACGDGFGGLLISNEQEVELGVGVDAELRKTYRIAKADDPAAVWMKGFIEGLVASSTGFRDPAEIGGYKVAVIVDDELVNAFAAPGGFTYITTALIMQSETCGEIAGVMGHELAHVTERHSVKSIEGQYAVSTISEWFLGEGVSSEVAQGIFAFLNNTQFSQEHESEADLVGLQISHDSGYNPYGLVDFFSKLLALAGGDEVPKFLSSHPPTAERITAATNEIERRYGDSVNPGTTQTYECVGTNLTLAQLKAHIQAGVAIEPGTGPQ